MLKAVRFDEDKHKTLLKFMEDFRDDKGKPNDSEAVRFLMQKGLEYLTATPIPQPQPVIEEKIVEKIIEQPKPSLDIDSLKRELLTEMKNEMLKEMNNQHVNSLTTIIEKLDNLKPVVVQQPMFTQMNTPIPTTEVTEQQEIKPKAIKNPIEIPKDTNPLLANILANSQR
jgi:hypothetical protein